MDKRILAEMGRRYPRTGPTVIIKWTDGPRGIDCLTHLNNLIDDHEIMIEWIDPRQVVIPVCSGNWEYNESREILARFPLGFALRDDFSLNVLSSGGLEGIRMANEGSVNALMSDCKKDREEIAEAIIRECLGDNLESELSTRKVLVHAELCTIEELPAIKFVFERRSCKILEVLIDGWSGSIIIDRAVQNAVYTTGDHFREFIGLTAEGFIENTAV